ncbi:MAG: TonB-dependent receptor [Steroidobacteraceae bacterium]|jgi:outer membrane receptor protein involved in Fe transport|nr:TonB-dependent receptor [Steroidobacteraceae bacterium]
MPDPVLAGVPRDRMTPAHREVWDLGLHRTGEATIVEAMADHPALQAGLTQAHGEAGLHVRHGDARGAVPGTSAGSVARAAEPPAVESGQLEEIVVTDQRRWERLQDAAVAVNAFTAETLESANVDRPGDVLKLAPNVTFVQSLDQNGSNQELFEIQQIEVLKGPQGALVIATRDPNFEHWEGRVELDGANRSEVTGQLGFSGPLASNFARRGAVSYRDRDGFYRDDNTVDRFKEKTGFLRGVWRVQSFRSRTAEFTQVQPKFAARWTVTDDLSACARWGRGFKTGGSPSTSPASTRSPRTRSCSRFFPQATLQAISTADEVETSGFEAERQVRPLEGLDLIASCGYLESEVTRFASQPTFVGNVRPSTSPFTAMFAAQYSTAVGSAGWNFVARGDHTRQGRTVWDWADTPGASRSAFDLVNARVALRNDSWEFAVWGKNLGDTAYDMEHIVLLPFAGALYRAAPRQYGAEIAYRSWGGADGQQSQGSPDGRRGGGRGGCRHRRAPARGHGQYGRADRPHRRRVAGLRSRPGGRHRSGRKTRAP